MKGGRPTQATIRLPAVRANFAEARRLAGDRDLIAVVKADAYGHGALDVSRALVAAGCPSLATLTVAEAVELRDGGLDVPIIVLGGLHDSDEAAEAAAVDLTPVLHHAGQLEGSVPRPATNSLRILARLAGGCQSRYLRRTSTYRSPPASRMKAA